MCSATFAQFSSNFLLIFFHFSCRLRQRTFLIMNEELRIMNYFVFSSFISFISRERSEQELLFHCVYLTLFDLIFRVFVSYY